LIVAPGDTLWQIARSWIGTGATDSDIDNAWRAWYFTNQDVIGDDPDLILPGQSLAAPALGEGVRS
jgi:nucleoid-associated protein YgaU